VRFPVHAPNLAAARAFAFAASFSRFLGAVLISSEQRRRIETSGLKKLARKSIKVARTESQLNIPVHPTTEGFRRCLAAEGTEAEAVTHESGRFRGVKLLS